jgi:hypothetical protein
MVCYISHYGQGTIGNFGILFDSFLSKERRFKKQPIEGRHLMQLEDMRKNSDLINSLDWDMTPEKAVCIYLEWGTCWSMNRTYPRWARDEETHYFVVSTWKRPVTVNLVRRNKDEYEELATITLPESLEKRFLDSVGHNKGVYGVEGEVKEWLQSQLHLN